MKVAVLGELNVDMILTGTDIMPEMNREKLLDGMDIVLGSSSAITACALAALGAEVEFVSLVGDDDFGRFCLQELNRMGVSTRHVSVDASLQTGVTLSFSAAGDRSLLTFPGTIPLLEPRHIPASLLAETDHVHFGSYFLQSGMRDEWPALFGRVRSTGKTTSFDTGWDVSNEWRREGIDRLLPVTDLFIPSEEELLHLYGADSLEAAWEEMPAGVGEGAVAVKRGASGAVLYRAGYPPVAVPAYPVTVRDTTGAGDCFNAGLIYGYRTGRRGEELLQFACACGALSVQGVGGTGCLPTVAAAERLMGSEAGQEL
ncbi:carbohydrate kinase family protein [Paenibacillus sp. GCM10027626]|uniref:carbohydrate kinase family protein n=1 Tax=Paenibacillus sp. GCM10027626 TaxID=3273411 RepID=UPI0036405CEB